MRKIAGSLNCGFPVHANVGIQLHIFEIAGITGQYAVLPAVTRQEAELLVTEAFDRIEVGGLDGRIDPEDETDQRTDAE